MTTEPLRSAAQNAESRQLPAEGPRASRGQGAPRWALSYALGDDATALGDDATQRGTHSANTDPSLGVRRGDRSVEQHGPSPQSAAPHFKTRPSRSGPYVAPPPTSPRPHATHSTPPHPPRLHHPLPRQDKAESVAGPSIRLEGRGVDRCPSAPCSPGLRLPRTSAFGQRTACPHDSQGSGGPPDPTGTSSAEGPKGSTGREGPGQAAPPTQP